MNFFLAAHKGIKGHSIRCHYHVLHTGHLQSDFGARDLEVVTYQLYHVYAGGNKIATYASPANLVGHCDGPPPERQ